MGAADEIRAGERSKFEALEEAGLNNHLVELFVFISSTGGNDIVGKQGDRRYNRLILKPNPQVELNRREIITQDGFQTASDAQLQGAFPEVLKGFEVILNDAGQQTASVAISKAYASAKEFRLDVEKTDYILIDGERYVFRGGAYLNINKTETVWKMKLLKADK